MGQYWVPSRPAAPPTTATASSYNKTRTESYPLERTETVRSVAGGLLKLRGRSDNLPQRWWFASTAIPLLAATIGPLSNVLSIAALVTPWRVTLPDNGQLPDGTDDNGVGIKDPHWEIILNALSLACGFAGNLFLLVNFTGRVRYIIALPLSIVFWLMSSGLLIGITSALSIYGPPISPGETYSQGFWHAVMAAVLYIVGGILLTINMIGYFRGHYPQQFDLDDDQRTLILQTMMFFFWLAGGAGAFCGLEGWTYPDALYYCDVSVLTIGFGDMAPKETGGRVFLFFFELIGIIFLGLVISSVSRFVANIGKDKIIKQHQKHARESTFGRTVTNERELRERLGLPPRSGSATTTKGSFSKRRDSLQKYGHINIVGRTVTFHERRGNDNNASSHRYASGGSSNPLSLGFVGVGSGGGGHTHRAKRSFSRGERSRVRDGRNTSQEKRRRRRKKLLLLKEEKDRFETMRQIQEETRRFKQYWALGMAFLAFGVLWGIGALVFMITEKRLSDFSYFESLYFCFVALLTIGYGDYSPKSNIGKPFFIVWSLIAVPIVTVLIQEMSRTVVSAVNRGTFKLADWTFMPKKGVFKAFLDRHPDLRDALASVSEHRQQRRRIARGFEIQNPDDPALDVVEKGPDDDDEDDDGGPVRGRQRTEKGDEDSDAAALERLAAETASGAHAEFDLPRQLSLSIKAVAGDIRMRSRKCYSYEQWVHFIKLIRFSRWSREEVELIEEEEGLVDWDWIGEDSPMLADISEPEWVLDRLCESLNRYIRRQEKEELLRKALKDRRIVRDRDNASEPTTEPESDSSNANGEPSRQVRGRRGEGDDTDDAKSNTEETATKEDGTDESKKKDDADDAAASKRHATTKKEKEDELEVEPITAHKEVAIRFQDGQ